MVLQEATEVRKEWSAICDDVMHKKPSFIKRTRDYMCLSSLSTMLDILDAYHFTADEFIEKDGSVTLSLNEIDLVVNGCTEEGACGNLTVSIIEYANEYYDNFELYSRSPNRKSHIPYIMKALILEAMNQTGDMIIFQAGKN